MTDSFQLKLTYETNELAVFNKRNEETVTSNA